MPPVQPNVITSFHEQRLQTLSEAQSDHKAMLATQGVILDQVRERAERLESEMADSVASLTRLLGEVKAQVTEGFRSVDDKVDEGFRGVDGRLKALEERHARSLARRARGVQALAAVAMATLGAIGSSFGADIWKWVQTWGRL